MARVRTPIDWLRTAAAYSRKNAHIAITREERWRYDLFLLRKLIDSRRWNKGLGKRTSDTLAARLLRSMETQPRAVAPSVRQLRRIRRKPEALSLVEKLWDTKAQTSAEWALACAIAWYDDLTMWRGDLALAHAMEIAPNWITLYEEQALNRSSRGHLALAVEAAERVIELDPTPETTRHWSEFIGNELFKGEKYERALEYLERGEPAEPTWVHWYRRGVCSEETGRTAAAADLYARAGAMRVPELSPELRTAALHYYQAAIPKTLIELERTPKTESADYFTLLGSTLLRLERPEDAVTRLRSRDQAADTGDVARVAALAEELAGNYREATAEYRAAIDRHGLDLHHRLARTLHAAGRVEEAAATWVEAVGDTDSLIDLDPEVDPVFSSPAPESLVERHPADPNAAIAHLRRLSASASSIDNVLRLHRRLGLLLASNGQPGDALRAFMRASIDLTPHPSEAEPQFAPLGPFERYAAAYEALPLEPGVVLYESFHGARTACNPLALCRHLLRERPDLHHVWAITEGAPVHESLLDDPRVSFVRLHSEGYRLHLATAGTLINNTSFPRYFVRRAGQRYLNTWHGVPWKKLGRDFPADPYGYDNIARNILQATHTAFPDEHTEQVMLNSQDVGSLSTAQSIVTGQPRVDSTINMTQSARVALRARLGVTPEQHTVLYAPTWRGTTESMESSVDPFLGAIDAMARIPGIQLLLRVHHFVSSSLRDHHVPDNVHIVPEDIDTNELLAITDVLVSDYSSLIFDYAPLERPIVKYIFDYESYSADRGLYFTADQIPGVDCMDEIELVSRIRQAVHDPAPVDWSSSPTSAAWKNDDGRATERVVDALFREPCPERPAGPPSPSDRLLISTAGLNANGITRSLRNLTTSTPEIAKNTQLMILKSAVVNPNNRETASELHQSLNFTLTVHQRCFTRRENLAWARLQAADQPIADGLLQVLRLRMQRERRRLFGDTEFAAVVDFDGYGLHQAALLSLGFPSKTRRVYVLHAEFENERILKYPYLAATGRVLPHFDVLASVSESTRELNERDLAREYDVPERLNQAMPNTLDVDGIRRKGVEPLDEDLSHWFSRPGPHVIVVGRLSVEKNHAALLEALAKVNATPDRSLRIALLGDGPRKLHLIRQVEDLGLTDHVFFAGYRPNPYPAMMRADALLLPSLHEGQALVLLEAMTLGTPVASSNSPAPAAALRGGELGLLVEPTADGLATALTAIAHSALATTAAFDPDAYQQAAAEAFKRVVGMH